MEIFSHLTDAQNSFVFSKYGFTPFGILLQIFDRHEPITLNVF